MDRKAIFKLILIISIPIFLFLTINQFFANSYDGNASVSYSIETSKKNNLYLGLYRPLNDSIQLKDKKIKALGAWAESCWQNGHNFFFFKTMEKKKGINLIIPYSLTPNQTPYFLMKTIQNEFDGIYPKLGFVFYYSDIPNKIKIVIEQRKNDSWEETINTDTITYERKF